MIKVFIIGAGNGGKAVLRRLLRFNWVQIAGVADLNPKAPGVLLAKEANLPVYLDDPLETLAQMNVDLVFEQNGNQKIQDQLLKLPSRTFNNDTNQTTKQHKKKNKKQKKQENNHRSHLG